MFDTVTSLWSKPQVYGPTSSLRSFNVWWPQHCKVSTESKMWSQLPWRYGRLPIHVASCNGHLRVVKCLIEEHSCNPHAKARDGMTPLSLAATLLWSLTHCSILCFQTKVQSNATSCKCWHLSGFHLGILVWGGEDMGERSEPENFCPDHTHL